MKKNKLLAVIITVIALVCMFTLFASAEEPVQDGFVYNAEGGYYVFYDCGNIVTDCEIWVEQYNAYFRVDQEGRMLNEEWYLADNGNWYYYKAGGYRAERESLQIGGVYYAFNNEGVMVDGKDEEIYLIDKDLWVFVRAKAGGPIYVNEWYLDQDGTWYYYGENGYTTEGILEYGGNYYYIGYRGEMYADGEYNTYDEATEKWVWYRIKPDGVLYRNEWFKGDYGKYYYTDNCTAAYGYLTVDGVNRFFYDGGYMCFASNFYDESSGCSYVVNQKGVATQLNANGWTLVGKDYYYCENGQMLTDGVYEIGGASYYFYGDGIMLQDNYVYDYESACRYRAGKSGALYRNQWVLEDDYGWSNERWEYYGDDCKGYSNGIYTIGNAQYFFSDSIAVSDGLIEFSDGEGVFVADKSCALTKYSNGWLLLDDEWYYVENDLLVKNRIKQIGDYKYGFDYAGRMHSDEHFEVAYYNELGDYYEFLYYLAGESGAVVETPGWAVAGEYFYYVTEGGSLYLGDMDVNGTVYHLLPQMNAASFDYNEEDDSNEATLYVVLPNGVYQKVTASGYYSTPYGKLLVENGKIYQGWKQSGANWYYFDLELVAGRTIYIDGSMYYFDHSGKMAAGGWIDCGYTYKYADAYGRLADGLTNINGTDYIFDSSDMVHNSLYFCEDGFWYVTNDSGRAFKLAKEGWNQIENEWYYIQDGEICLGKTVIIENDAEVVYFFDYESGKMLSNHYDGSSYFDETGRRLEKGWVYYNGGWRYFDPYECWWGIYTIDGVEYFFEYGIMLADTTYYDFYEQTVYVIDAYGIVVNEFDMADGFTYANGNAWLLKDGFGYTGWYGDYYFRDGVMLINQLEKIDGKLYYFTPKGTYLRGWYKDVDDTWIFADQSGVVATNQWIQSGSAWYYADSYGWCLCSGVEYIEAEDKYALFDENSVFVKYIDFDEKAPTGPANTWGYVDGYWYYYTSTGVAATNNALYIGNSWYYFDGQGKMFANEFDYDGFYYQSSGARLEATCEWKLINGKWLYFGSNGSVETDWINLNGTKYYIVDKWDYYELNDEEDFGFELYTGFRIIDGKAYQFSASGACLGEYTTNGWVQLYDGSFAYIKDGKLLTDGVYNINGTDYCFDYEGYMVVNDYYYSESTGKCVYASSSGALLGAGWHNTEKGWVYIDAKEGLITSGVYLINNGLYFFNDGYWVS